MFCCTSSSPQGAFAGLKNPGLVRCHLNVCVQALHKTPEFRDGLMELHVTDKAVPTELRNLFAKLDASGRALSTDPLIKALGWDIGSLEQQDANDTWLSLHDRLEKDLAKNTVRPKLVQELFEGRQTVRITCDECGAVSDTVEATSSLSLPVAELHGSEAEPVGVHAALRARVAAERLTGDEQFQCDKCNGKHDATRETLITSLPPVLCFHLTRFKVKKQSDGAVELERTNHAFQFEETLTLDEFLQPPASPSSEANDDHTSVAPSAVYDLYAIIVHHGMSPNEGHYWSLIRDLSSTSETEGEWFEFNDERCLPMRRASRAETVGGGSRRDTSAYMLLYRRRSAGSSAPAPTAAPDEDPKE